MSRSGSIAAREAFDLLNAATAAEYRGWGDTRTAARDRAAVRAGVTPAQATRLWKHWQTMASVDGDVYRGLRNAYGHLCDWIEAAADRMERNRLQRAGNTSNETDESIVPSGAGDRAAGGKKAALTR